MGCREKLEPSSARCCLSPSSESAAEDRMLRASSAHRFDASLQGLVAEGLIADGLVAEGASDPNPASTFDAASGTYGSPGWSTSCRPQDGNLNVCCSAGVNLSGLAF